MTPELELKVEHEIRMLLHAGRDCMRNQKKHDTKLIRFDVNNPYFGEAFGIMRALALMNFGTLDYGHHEHPKQNLKSWFEQIEQAVLDEEHFDGDHHCDYCLARYGKDDARTKRKEGLCA